MMMRFAVLALCLLAAVSAEQALLLAGKTLINKVAAQNQDVVVKYTLFNIGDGPATDISLEDGNFDPEWFEIVGLTSASWSQLDAGANVSHVVIVRPKFTNYFNFTSAKVTFSSNGEKHATLSSNPGVVGIASEGNYYREFDPHYVDWVLILALLALPIGFPYLKWKASVDSSAAAAEKKEKSSKKH